MHTRVEGSVNQAQWKRREGGAGAKFFLDFPYFDSVIDPRVAQQ